MSKKYVKGINYDNSNLYKKILTIVSFSKMKCDKIILILIRWGGQQKIVIAKT